MFGNDHAGHRALPFYAPEGTSGLQEWDSHKGGVSANLLWTGENADWCYVEFTETSPMARTDSMEDRQKTEERQSMVINGHKLEIIATKIYDGEWSLCIENVHGIRSEWFEFFESSDIALEAGRTAVETEGVEEFISKEGFEYLP